MVSLTLFIVRRIGDVTRNMRLLAVYSREYFRMQYKRKRLVHRYFIMIYIFVFFFLSFACLIRRRNRHLTNNRTIASLSEAECWSRFKTRKEDLLEVTMWEVFDLEFSMLSRAFHMFTQHMIVNFKHLLLDNLLYWKLRFPLFCRMHIQQIV